MNLSDSISPIRDEINETIKRIIDNTNFIGGSEIDSFESEFAAFCNTDFCVGCSNGTDALVLALKALEIGPGDTVLVPANTFIATSESVTFVGASVEFVDVIKNHWTIDPLEIEKILEKDTEKKIKAVIPVHLYGQMADMPAIRKLADKYDIKIIEDSAQAHGAKINGRGPGLWGDIATFSFYPGKNLGAFGDAGALVTNIEEYAVKARAFANHGRMPGQKYEHDFQGSNLRLDALQAAILRVKLRMLNKETKNRINLAKRYTEKLSRIDSLLLPVENENSDSVYHLYVIHCENRDELKQHLSDHSISSGIHYPIPLHLQGAYSYMGLKEGAFKTAEFNAGNCLSLPMWGGMNTEQQDYVIDAIIDFFKR